MKEVNLSDRSLKKENHRQTASKWVFVDRKQKAPVPWQPSFLKDCNQPCVRFQEWEQEPSLHTKRANRQQGQENPLSAGLGGAAYERAAWALLLQSPPRQRGFGVTRQGRQCGYSRRKHVLSVLLFPFRRAYWKVRSRLRCWLTRIYKGSCPYDSRNIKSRQAEEAWMRLLRFARKDGKENCDERERG